MGKSRGVALSFTRYTTLKGQDQTLELTDFNARIIQHEIDHLDGVLFCRPSY